MPRSYIVSTNGGGSAFTQSEPGSLNGAIRLAQPGDEIILKDGIYRQFVRFRRSGTRGNPITLRAENPQQATIALRPGVREGKFGGKNSVINTKPFSYITIRNLTVDGMGLGESGITADNGSNLIIEYNHIRNTGSGGIGMKAATDSIIRFNLIENTGASLLGEGMYIGESNGMLTVSRLEVYGNIIRRTCMNFIDSKRGNQNINVHHNIMEDLLPGRSRPDLNAAASSDGFVLLGSSGQNGSRVENNIFRNTRRDRPAQLLKISQNSRHLVKNNVFHNVNNQRAISGHQNGTTSPTVITANVFHNLSSYVVNSIAGEIGGINIIDNKMDAAQTDSEAEEKRILAELLSLTGALDAPWIKDLVVEDGDDGEDGDDKPPLCEFPCGFCGRSEEDVDGFVRCSPVAMICSECIVNSYEQFLEWVKENKNETVVTKTQK